MKRGGRFVCFPYALSALLATFRRHSPIYFIRAGERPAGRGWKYALLSALLGWWGVPFGPVHTFTALRAYWRGGTDVTHNIVRLLFQASRRDDSSPEEDRSEKTPPRPRRQRKLMPWETAASSAA